MPRNLSLISLSIILLAATWVGAQDAPPSGSPPQSQPQGHTRQEPCWQEAGIPASAVKQHQEIERDARSQVGAVCADTSLTPQQKRERIREIRRDARQKTEELVTPEQEKTLTACREQRGTARAGTGRERGNPCVAPGPKQTAPPSGGEPNSGAEQENKPQDNKPQR